MLFHSLSRKASFGNIAQNAANGTGPKMSSRKPAANPAHDECGYYTFINNPATKKSFSLPEMREAFLSIFREKRAHTHKALPGCCPMAQRHLP